MPTPTESFQSSGQTTHSTLSKDNTTFTTVDEQVLDRSTVTDVNSVTYSTTHDTYFQSTAEGRTSDHSMKNTPSASMSEEKVTSQELPSPTANVHVHGRFMI